MQNHNTMGNPLYTEDMENCLDCTVNLQQLREKKVLITGATGMIGSFVVDTIMHANATRNLNCTIIAMGRNEKRAMARFNSHWGQPHFIFIQHDVNHPLPPDLPRVDYVIHSASNTHPVAYATEPIATITTNIFGTLHLLNFIVSQGCGARMVLTSSVEIYGQNRGDVAYFDEDYCGYIDCNTLRAGYPESKRLSEALCQAYYKEKGVDFVSARLPRVYGPTLLQSDTKALSQFIRKGIAGEDIVLKSKGDQFFSYAYVADAAAGMLTTMLAGNTAEAYNIADVTSDITLRELAQLVAANSGTALRFELPDNVEMAGYSTATRAVQNASKLNKLGWKPYYDIKNGIARTLDQLRQKKVEN